MIALLLLLAAAVPAAQNTPEDAVRDFYAQIVERKPLGIPRDGDRKALWPLMTPRLASVLETAQACEDDYMRRIAKPDEKPEFAWLELGLFSGGNEQALPAEVRIVGAEELGERLHRVSIRFTYREESQQTFAWDGEVMVDCSAERCLVDDFIAMDDDTGQPFPPLSETFEGCRDGKWVGLEQSVD